MRAPRARCGLVLALLAGTAAYGVLGHAAPARAHGLEPARLALRETQPGIFDVTWKSSKLRLPGASVAPHLPPRCRQVAPALAIDQGDRTELHSTIDCGVPGLAGETLGVDGLEVARITALLELEHLDGTTTQSVLNARTPSIVVPGPAAPRAVLRDYLTLGLGYVLAAPAQLLLLLGLLLLAATTRTRVLVVTAFALGSSVSLSAAALGAAPLPSRAIPLLIAASVLLLAVELARDDARDTPLRRFAWPAAFAFGLLAGLGPATALGAAGPPPGDVPRALLAFNVGVELGLLAFVLVVGLLASLARRRLGQHGARGQRCLVYAMGIVAAFWCFERAASWLS